MSLCINTSKFIVFRDVDAFSITAQSKVLKKNNPFKPFCGIL